MNGNASAVPPVSQQMLECFPGLPLPCASCWWPELGSVVPALSWPCLPAPGVPAWQSCHSGVLVWFQRSGTPSPSWRCFATWASVLEPKLNCTDGSAAANRTQCNEFLIIGTRVPFWLPSSQMQDEAIHSDHNSAGPGWERAYFARCPPWSCAPVWSLCSQGQESCWLCHQERDDTAVQSR